MAKVSLYNMKAETVGEIVKPYSGNSEINHEITFLYCEPCIFIFPPSFHENILTDYERPTTFL